MNKKATIKVNKFGMSLVVGMFLFVLLFSIVSSASENTWTFSAKTSNPQYYSSQGYRSYSQQYAPTYWPILSNPDKCEATTDFIVSIRPGSCTPAVVRSDLLEEQNVPIFCKVDVTKINPLIDVTHINSVKFNGATPPEVAGISFHPNREAVYSQGAFIDTPLMNDVGYIVVVLKRISAERDMPDEITFNVTAVLRYDAENFFGAEKSSYYLEVMDDSEWEIGDNYMNNSFFKGRGYLRADWVESDNAGISIYLDKEQKLGSFNLKKGETSGLVYLPGFYCKAGVQVKLEDIVAGVNRVQLDVRGEKIWLIKGEKFLEDQCTIVEIREDSVKISCKEQGTRVLDFKPEEKEKSTITLKESDEEILKRHYSDEEIKKLKEELDYLTEAITVWKAFSVLDNPDRDKVLDILEDIEEKISEKQETEKEEAEEKAKVEKKDKEISQEIKDYFNEAKLEAESIRAEYGDAGTATRVWAAEALLELAKLANTIGLEKTAEDIFEQIIDDYPETAYPGTAYEKEARVGLHYSTADSTIVGDYDIKLLNIKTPSKEEASADFVVWELDDNEKRKERQEYDTIQEEEVFGKDIKLKLEKLYLDKVKLSYGKTEKDFKSTTLNEGESKIVKIDNKKYEIRLDDIQLQPVAKVKLISNAPSTYSEADFTFAVGIEKRAIKLSPEKTLEMIENLNESIEKFEDIVENLGNVVEGMKAACLTTATILVVKNFFQNLGGGSMARQEVNEIWNSYCKKKSGGDEEQFDKCLEESATQMNTDMQVSKKAITDTNEKTKQIKEANTKDDELNEDGYKNGLRNLVGEEVSYAYKEDEKSISGTIDEEHLKEASSTQLAGLYRYKNEAANAVSQQQKDYANKKIKEIGDRLTGKSVDKELYGGDGNKWLKNFKVKYFMSGDNKGLVSIMPIPGKYEKDAKTAGKSGEKATGFYVYVDESKYGREGRYKSSGRISSFWIQNIGNDGTIDISDDKRFLVTERVLSDVYDSQKQIQILDLTPEASKQLVKDAEQAIEAANRNFGRTGFTFNGERLLIDTIGITDEVQCTDFMSASDCKWLFNLCDPVLCPSSRCDLGGKYKVDDVVQSGIIGSIALCMPNFVGFGGDVYIPVCLTGIHAGLDAYVQVLKGHRDCLQYSLETGQMVGICDQIYSIYLCEFFWRQIMPFLNNLIPNLISWMTQGGTKGGGEYLTVQNAWDSAKASVDWMKNNYAVNAYKAFQARSTGEIGTEICKVFISQRYPNNKDFFDNLLQPDSPVQFTAWFDEIPYTDATDPATSQYKVFYNIYAGNDEGVNYQVYLKNPPTKVYGYIPNTIVVDTGYIPIGTSAIETKDFTAPAGYSEICVRINGKDECGFKRVTTSFALNYVQDKYYEEQLKKTNIKTEEQCTSGEASLLGISPARLQESADDILNPELENKGVVRVCSSSNPGGQGDERWVEVGYCGDEEVKCWLDMETIEDVIKNKGIEESVKAAVSGDVSKLIEETEMITETSTQERLEKVRKIVNELEQTIKKENNKDVFLGKLITSFQGIEAENIGNLEEVMIELDYIAAHAPYNVYSAEAVFLKFRIYGFIVRKIDALEKYEEYPEGGKSDLIEGLEGEGVSEGASDYQGPEETEQRTRWDYDSAIDYIDNLENPATTYYSNQENKKFIDEICEDELIDFPDCEQIKGVQSEGDEDILPSSTMEHVRELLRQNKARDERIIDSDEDSALV